MKNFFLLILVFLSFESAFAQGEQLKFMENIRPLCGKSFPGKVVYPEEGREPFSSNPLTMIVAVCTGETVKIPFHVGSDRSRTWILSFTDQGLQLKHDHRQPDGSPDEVTNYGGLASVESDAWEMHFPADEETIEMLPRAQDNTWTMAIDRDAKIFSYILSVGGKKAVQIDFDIDLGIHSGL